jgi:hypothetical protein
MEPNKKVRRVTLNSLAAGRRYAQWLLLNVEAGNITENKGRVLNSILRTLVDILDTEQLDVLAERMAFLEIRIAEGGNKIPCEIPLALRAKLDEVYSGISERKEINSNG